MSAYERMMGFHPQQAFIQRQPHLGERLLSSDGEMAWDDR
jgi:hypothetical protein